MYGERPLHTPRYRAPPSWLYRGQIGIMRQDRTGDHVRLALVDVQQESLPLIEYLDYQVPSQVVELALGRPLRADEVVLHAHPNGGSIWLHELALVETGRVKLDGKVHVVARILPLIAELGAP